MSKEVFPWPLRCEDLSAIMISISPRIFWGGGIASDDDGGDGDDDGEGEEEESRGNRKRLMSPIMRSGESSFVAVIWFFWTFSSWISFSLSEEEEEKEEDPGVVVVVDDVVSSRGWQMIKVSLSESNLQERCIAYSSSRLRGSDAVAAWRSGSCIHWW